MLYFCNALNPFYLRLYGIRHMVKDHSNSKKVNQLSPHGLLFPINSKGSFYMHHPTDRRIAQPLLHQSWSIGWIDILLHSKHFCLLIYGVNTYGEGPQR